MVLQVRASLGAIIKGQGSGLSFLLLGVRNVESSRIAWATHSLFQATSMLEVLGTTWENDLVSRNGAHVAWQGVHQAQSCQNHIV